MLTNNAGIAICWVFSSINLQRWVQHLYHKYCTATASWQADKLTWGAYVKSSEFFNLHFFIFGIIMITIIMTLNMTIMIRSFLLRILTPVLLFKIFETRYPWKLAHQLQAALHILWKVWQGVRKDVAYFVALKGHSQLWDRADLDTTFVNLKRVYLNPKSNERVGYI